MFTTMIRIPDEGGKAAQQAWAKAQDDLVNMLNDDNAAPDVVRRAALGRLLLDYADQGSEDPDSDGRLDELWRLANSLLFDPKQTPITVIAGKLVERDLESFTAPTRLRMVAAKRGHMREAGAA